MEQPVQQGGGHDLVAEDPAPFLEALVRGRHGRGVAVAPVDELEEEDRATLRDRQLRSVSCDDDWSGWCEFFLDAVRAQAEDNLVKTEAILELYEEMKDLVLKVTNSRYAIRALDSIFRHPVLTSAQFVEGTDSSPPTARRILRRLCESGVLQKIDPAHGRRPALFVFHRLLDIAEGRKNG